MKDLKEVPKKKDVSEIKVPDIDKNVEKVGEYSAEIIRDYYGAVDPFYLSKKDPEFAYRFIRDDPKNLSLKKSNLLLQKGGWQIVPREHLEKLGLTKEISPDGMLRRGDTILAFMPKKLFDEKQAYKEKRANEPMTAIKRLIKEGDPSAGRGIHGTMRGIETGKQLGMK